MADTEGRVVSTAVTGASSSAEVEDSGQKTCHTVGQDSSGQQRLGGNKRKSSEPGESRSRTSSTTSSPTQADADDANPPLKKFFCPCCNIGHSTSEDLINHVREFPIKLETFSCNICMLEFFVKSDLIDHQRLDHQVTTHKTFKCDECDLEYANLSQLNRHKKMHEEIAKKLAACGVFLPRPKKSDPAPPKENTSGTAFPYSYPQSATSTDSASQPEKNPPSSEESCNVEERLKEEETEPAEDCETVDLNITSDQKVEKNTASSPPVTRHRSTRRASKSKEDSHKEFVVSLNSAEHKTTQKKKPEPDEDWQEYNSSDFVTSGEEVSDDPDYHQSKSRRGRGRPRLTRKVKKQETPVRPPREKRKCSASKILIEAKKQVAVNKVKVKEERQQRAKRRREDKPAAKKLEEEAEEPEVPAHLRNKDGSIQCPDCDVICYSLRGLNRHRKFHFRTMDKMKCLLCEEVFSDKQTMNTHMRREHKFRQSRSNETASGSQEIRCTEPDCDEVFNSGISLTKHRVKDHGIDKSQLHKCDECGKVYSGSTELKNHKRMHTNERPFTCSLCSKAYRSSGGLLWHLKTHNDQSHDILNKYKDIKVTEEGNYACGLCSKEFKSLHGIRIHKENPQKKCSATPGYWGKWKPKPAICEVCGRKFPSKVTLKSHMVTHTGERPHKCRYCEVTFKHYKNKFIHEKMHRNQKDFICNVCGKAFYDGTNLKTHIDSHKEIKDLPCQLCGKLFHVEINRRRHEKRCRNFIRCHICLAVFRQQERLMRHIMINHHGAQMQGAEWLPAQPLPLVDNRRTEPVVRQQAMDTGNNSRTEPVVRQQAIDNSNNSTFVDSFLFANNQPPQPIRQYRADEL